ncbi:MAG: YbaY family lipoprotein [Halioglobus sp.]
MLSKYATRSCLLAVTMAIGLAACGGDNESENTVTAEESAVSTIEGEVFYRERMMLPPGAEVEIQLQDVSRADALATVMETVMFKPEGGPPYPFTIEYQRADIDERMRYSLRATITLGDQLMFTSTEFIDPFRGEPISIMVQRVPEPVTKAAAQPAEPVTPAEPEEAEVAEEAEAVEEVSVAPAQEETTDAKQSDLAIWELATLEGGDAPLGAGGKKVDLALNAQDGTASGFSGCNRYQGSFSNEGSSTHGTPLKFGPMASTMRACADGEDTERAYLALLGKVNAYRLKGSGLELLRGDKVVATFKLR